MVKTVEVPTLSEAEDFDIPSWVASLDLNPKHYQQVVEACELVRAAVHVEGNSQESWGSHTNCLFVGVEIAATLSGLKADHTTLTAAILYRAVREERIALTQVEALFGDKVALLVDGVSQMDAITVSMDTRAVSLLGQNQSQVDNLRRMLVTIIGDVRVVLLKLAERCAALRNLKPDPERARQVAKEVSAIFAPLAHRLGVGHLKWELEDLSFRYTNPQEYKRIAKQLDGKRLERQAFIENVTQVLQTSIAEAGVKSEVRGRIKHIYSIWRKMQRKNIDFDHVYDVRALRVLVDSTADCYTVLGHAHSLWHNISNEFDDYIASPKPNGYRSLHTAVYGPEGKVIEIQIRTHEMHIDAEFGVCAHWAYKGTDKQDSGTDSYEQKIEWLRQVLAWQEEMGDVRGVSADVAEDRIYVFTPKGHVVDLPTGSTPLDFAYHVHTEVGHRCRGAKVDGRIVPITAQLKTGQHIEILTGTVPDPSRDWLRTDLGYCQSGRTRSKIQQWFRQQNRETNLLVGRSLVEREFKRLDLTSLDYKEVATKLHRQTVEDLYVAVGAGDITINQVANAAERIVNLAEAKQLNFVTFTPRAPSPPQATGITVQGVGNLLTSVASCCHPINGDDIGGYITGGRGVSVHKADCLNLLNLKANEPERIIMVSWGESSATYPAVIRVEAYDRKGLLLDITKVLMDTQVNVIDMATLSNKEQHIANMKFTVEVASLDILSSLLVRISNIPNVLDASRMRET